ncbi:type II toxin-antitoxin system VapC family toxin [Methanolapillus africanus]
MNIFIDTNIFLSVYFPKNNYFSDICERDYNKFLKNKTKLYTDFTVISELFNRTLKISWKNYCLKNHLNQNQFSYKKYRETNDFSTSIDEVCQNVCQILSNVNLVNFEYDSNDLSLKISKNKFNTIDFNDFHIMNVCQKYDLCLWTNDIDFKDKNIKIFTENGKYFDQKIELDELFRKTDDSKPYN